MSTEPSRSAARARKIELTSELAAIGRRGRSTATELRAAIDRLVEAAELDVAVAADGLDTEVADRADALTARTAATTLAGMSEARRVLAGLPTDAHRAADDELAHGLEGGDQFLREAVGDHRS